MSNPDETPPALPADETTSPSPETPAVEEKATPAVEEKAPETPTKEETPAPNVSEEKPTTTDDTNVNFEKEREFFNANKDNLKNKIASLQSELEEEKKLAETLHAKDVADDTELNNIRAFLDNNNDEISSLHDVVNNLSNSLKTLVKSNKAKQDELKSQNEEYASLVNSESARALAGKIKHIRTILGQLEDFLVKEGVQGPNSPQ